MTTQVCEYANDGQRITQLGKFEGEPLFAPWLWSLGLEGMADHDNGASYGFRFTKEDFAPSKPFGPELKKWLGRRRVVWMAEDSTGFVRCY